MGNNELRAAHPRRAGVGDAIRRLIPLADDDAEAKDERKLVRRIDQQEAVRK